MVKSYQRPASYWHCLPLYEQRPKGVVDGGQPAYRQTPHRRGIPAGNIASRDEQSMFLRFKWGSTWQIVGSGQV